MHMDPTSVALGTAIVSFATAITGLVRTILEKKHLNSHVRKSRLFKKTLSIPVFHRHPQKKSNFHTFPQTGNQSSVLRQFVSDSGIDFYITDPDNDHVLIGQCKRYA